MHALLSEARVQPLIETYGRPVVRDWIRHALDNLRDQSPGPGTPDTRDAAIDQVLRRLLDEAETRQTTRIGHVINATGVILHTGLGRAPLSRRAVAAMTAAAAGSNVEIDLESGTRRERGHQLAPLWKRLTGAEASLVVNNNAAATLLALRSLCSGREVIISRGQLIEIGGSFRLPDIFTESGAILREVGTTNRTRLSDYAAAIGPNTAAILHVHPSNYRIVGFTESPDIDELAGLAHEHNLLAIDDIGSGSLIDVTRFGLPAEPTFTSSLRAGADLVLGSGDKLLGGPQCGILLGKTAVLQTIRRHPLTRTVRIDKLTLAALSGTLESYERGVAEQEIPVLQLLSAPLSELQRRAELLRKQLAGLPSFTFHVEEARAAVGGGSLPAVELPTVVLVVEHASQPAESLAHRLRIGTHRVVGRVRNNRLWLDLRSVLPSEDADLELAVRALATHLPAIPHNPPPAGAVF